MLFMSFLCSTSCIAERVSWMSNVGRCIAVRPKTFVDAVTHATGSTSTAKAKSWSPSGTQCFQIPPTVNHRPSPWSSRLIALKKQNKTKMNYLGTGIVDKRLSSLISGLGINAGFF